MVPYGTHLIFLKRCKILFCSLKGTKNRTYLKSILLVFSGFMYPILAILASFQGLFSHIGALISQI